MTIEHQTCAVLVAEDDHDDQSLLQKAFIKNGIVSTPCFVSDGRELIDYLARPGAEGSALPHLILLDLNMPRLDGRETLKLIKADERLKKIPVVIFTTSKDPRDVSSSYAHGANSYLTKPDDYLELIALVGLLKDFWLQHATPPN